MNFRTLCYHCIFYIYCFDCVYAGIQQNWLKVISQDGHEYSVTSRQCFAGTWAPSPIPVKCICVTGMWAISKGFCDEDFEILTGEQHCFPVNRPIRKFSYIGSYWNQRRWYGNYVFRRDMPYVARFSSMDSEYFLQDHLNYVMRVNMTCSTLRAKSGGSSSRPNGRDEVCIPETRKTLSRSGRSVPLIEIFSVEGRSLFQQDKGDHCSGRRRMKPIVVLKPGQSWRPKLHEIRESTCIYPHCGPSILITQQTEKPQLNLSASTPRHPPLIDFSNTTPKLRLPPLLDFNIKPITDRSPLLDFNTHKPTRPPRPRTTTSWRPLTSTQRPTTKQTPRPPTTTKQTPRPTTTTRRSPPPTRPTKPYKPQPNTLQWKPIKPTTPKHVTGQPNDFDYEDDDKDPYWDNRFVPAEEKDQLIFEQTQRMFRMHVNFLMYESTYMQIDKAEFIYLRIAKNILLKTCPEKEVPKAIVNSVIRLFRYALYESWEVYPYIVLNDGDEEARINKSLIECHESAKMMEFKYNKTCRKRIDTVVHNFQEYNATLPDMLASNPTKLDFVLESVWKIMLHSHYYCAKNFRQNPADLSSLMMKWEAFFSPILRYRWRVPGNNWELYKTIFQQYDLHLFDHGLSKCLATAYAVSHYPMWVQRPVLSLAGSNNKLKSRGKRSSRREQCPPDQWNNQAYCIQKFFDPVRKYGVRPLTACLSEYNGRHDL